MTDPAPKPEPSEPDRFFWRGLRFKKVPVQRDEVHRYECEDWSYSCWLTKHRSGQWMAAFTNGVYSIEWNKEDALESAAYKHIEHLQYVADRFKDLLGLFGGEE